MTYKELAAELNYTHQHLCKTGRVLGIQINACRGRATQLSDAEVDVLRKHLNERNKGRGKNKPMARLKQVEKKKFTPAVREMLMEGLI